VQLEGTPRDEQVDGTQDTATFDFGQAEQTVNGALTPTIHPALEQTSQDCAKVKDEAHAGLFYQRWDADIIMNIPDLGMTYCGMRRRWCMMVSCRNQALAYACR
jgi:hypothetical protein